MPDTLKMTKENYFIGANTCSGFVFHAEPRFRELDRVFVINGGPGTGKSTVLKRIASRAEALGQRVERYYCSSDPASLDGVVLKDSSVGIIDGTPPHVYSMKCRGAVENVIDTGLFWNSALLHTQKDKIRELSSRKSGHFASAYRYLCSANVLVREERALLSSCFLKDKADAAIGRLLSCAKNGNGFKTVSRQISAVGMTGEARIGSICDASQTVSVRDCRELSPSVFDLIVIRARERGLELHVSYDPFLRPEEIYLKEADLLITRADEGERVLNTERFMDRDAYARLRSRLRILKKLRLSLIESAKTELSLASPLHFELESIYSEAMDFPSLESYSDDLIRYTLGLN